MSVLSKAQSRRPDYLLLALVGALLLVGLQAVYSASFVMGLNDYNNTTYFVLRQGLAALVGGAFLLLGMKIDYRRWKALSPWLMLSSLALLAITFIPNIGLTVNGARRWLSLGPLPPIQPSEFVKLALIIYMAAWLTSKGPRLRQTYFGLVPFVLVVGIIGGLIMLQPDMGTTVIIVLTATTLFFLAGADLKHFIILAVAGAGAMALLIFTAAYRFDRWQSFVDPWQDPAGTGFHIIQLLIALGSGGLWGLGPGVSRQKFYYIPGSHTDGIFAILGEEGGFLMSLLVLALFAVLIYRAFQVARHADDDFGALLAAGIACWIAYQTIINIGGITKSIPLTGVPLPFISYGGSSLITIMAAMGILLNISKIPAVSLAKKRASPQRVT